MEGGFVTLAFGVTLGVAISFAVVVLADVWRKRTPSSPASLSFNELCKGQPFDPHGNSICPTVDDFTRHKMAWEVLRGKAIGVRFDK
jgi:hypothetical protein